MEKRNAKQSLILELELVEVQFSIVEQKVGQWRSFHEDEFKDSPNSSFPRRFGKRNVLLSTKNLQLQEKLENNLLSVNFFLHDNIFEVDLFAMKVNLENLQLCFKEKSDNSLLLAKLFYRDKVLETGFFVVKMSLEKKKFQNASLFNEYKFGEFLTFSPRRKIVEQLPVSGDDFGDFPTLSPPKKVEQYYF